MLRLLLGLTGTALVVAVALYLLDWNGLIAALQRISFSSMLVCLLFILATHLCTSLRWALLIADRNESPRFSDMLIACQASVYNLVTPGAVGADAYRVIKSDESRGGRMRSAGLVLLERIMGIWGQSAVFLVAYLLSSGAAKSPVFEASASIFLTLAIGIIIGLALLSRIRIPSRWDGAAGRFARAAITGLTANGWQTNTAALALSFASVAVWAVSAHSISSDTGVGLALAPIALIAVVTELARMLPISLQGIGVREATFAWLASEAGGVGEAGFVACGVLYGLNYLVVAALGLLAGYAGGRNAPVG